MSTYYFKPNNKNVINEFGSEYNIHEIDYITEDCIKFIYYLNNLQQTYDCFNTIKINTDKNNLYILLDFNYSENIYKRIQTEANIRNGTNKNCGFVLYSQNNIIFNVKLVYEFKNNKVII